MPRDASRKGHPALCIAALCAYGLKVNLRQSGGALDGDLQRTTMRSASTAETAVCVPL